MKKIIMNRILTNRDLSEYKKNGYAAEQKDNIKMNPANDAWLKHSAIVEAVNNLNIEITSILDAGSYTPNHLGAPLYLAKNIMPICFVSIF